ncbi:MAG: hypothetical protein KDD60_11475, partial [Bdellovibrionales bacterium]|nr:hypothetical protein [Bdellovibrionales bacterium]
LGALTGLLSNWIETAVESTLMELLQEEAQKGCGCSFEVDDVHFSLFTMSAIAKNARITKNGIAHIQVPTIKAAFNPLSKIHHLRIAMTKLDLHNAHVEEVSPGTPAIEFIDHLAKPLSPEKKKAWKIRVKLMNLRVLDGTFRQPIGDSEINGDGIDLSFIRDKQDNLTLLPSARLITYSPAGQSPTVSLGHLVSSLYITDDSITFKEVVLRMKESFIAFSGELQKHTDDIKGELKSTIRGEDFQGLTGIRGTLESRASLSGPASHPATELSVMTPETSPLELTINEERYGPMQIRVHGNSTDSSPLTLPEASFIFPTGELRASSPLIISQSGIQGDLSFEFGEIHVSHSSFHDGKFEVKLLASPTGQSAELNGSIQMIRSEELVVPPLRIQSTLTPDRTVHVHVEHQKSSLGEAVIDAKMALSQSPLALESTSFSFHNFAVLHLGGDESFEHRDLIRITSNGEVHGPLNLQE